MSWSERIWCETSVPVFLEKFILPLFAALVLVLAVTNPINLDWVQRVTGSLAIIFAAYFVAHTVYKKSESDKKPVASAINDRALANAPAAVASLTPKGYTQDITLVGPERIGLRIYRGTDRYLCQLVNSSDVDLRPVTVVLSVPQSLDAQALTWRSPLDVSGRIFVKDLLSSGDHSDNFNFAMVDKERLLISSDNVALRWPNADSNTIQRWRINVLIHARVNSQDKDSNFILCLRRVVGSSEIGFREYSDQIPMNEF